MYRSASKARRSVGRGAVPAAPPTRTIRPAPEWSLSAIPAHPASQTPAAGPIQAKLMVGAADDASEREADRRADRVMRSPAPLAEPAATGAAIRRECSGGADEAEPASPAAQAAVGGLGSGMSLSPPDLEFFGSRFGRDFSNVRVHADAAADTASRALAARAFTVGGDVAFARGEYRPGTDAGRRLIAHELVHTLQQGEGGRSAVQRQEAEPDGEGPKKPGGTGGLLERFKNAARDLAAEKLNAITAKPGTGAKFALAGCHPKFCDPFANVAEAKADLIEVAPMLLAGISVEIDPRVEPLWATYLAGGSDVQDLTASFAEDFTASLDTENTAKFLYSALRTDVRDNVGALIGGAATTRILMNSRLAPQLLAIDTRGHLNAMSFNRPREIPGNIAGAIGKDQLSNPLGARPSGMDDARRAGVWVELERIPAGVRVTPSINFAVWDTIDLCPGNCGAETEQVATVPMSRFEATGLAGDVPFVVRFPAPASAIPPFEVPYPATAPKKAALEPAAGQTEDPAAMAAASLDPKRAGEAVAPPVPGV